MEAFIFERYARAWFHAVAIRKRTILLLSHVLEENFFLFFIQWLFFLSAFHHTLLVPTPYAAPPLHISCSGSFPCPFDTRGMSAQLALHALHTGFSSDPPGGISCLIVYWVATSPKSSPTVVAEACTWISLRLWFTEGPRDRTEGSYICSDCIYLIIPSSAIFFIPVCWTWHCGLTASINAPNIS